jgi:carbonic anhydrase
VDQKPGLRAAQANVVFLTAVVIAAGISCPTAFAAKVKWSYSGSTGPEHWATEDESYALCGHGKSQSPIDIEKTTKQDLPPLEFDYNPTALRVTDSGRSMQVNYQPGSALTVAGERYALVQFHFHKPSEEKLHGRAYSMVVHLVHRNEKGELAVVAVLLRSGKTNVFLQPIFDNFPPPGITESADAGQTLNVAELLPANQGYFSFEGSLTMPPCSEHVRWFVLKTPVEVSAAQIQKFAARYPRNARPVQPLNGRVILETKN